MREAPRIQSDGTQQFMAALPAFVARRSLCFKHDAGIALDGKVRKETRFLDHIADPSTQLDQVHIFIRLSANKNLSAGRRNHPIYCAQKRGLPEPLRPSSTVVVPASTAREIDSRMRRPPGTATVVFLNSMLSLMSEQCTAENLDAVLNSACPRIEQRHRRQRRSHQPFTGHRSH